MSKTRDKASTSSSPSKRSQQHHSNSSQSRHPPDNDRMEVTLDFDAGPGAVAAATVLPGELKAKAKNLKSPAELGIQMTPSQEMQLPPKQPQKQAAKILRRKASGGHQRSMAAIQCIKSPAAAAAAANFKFETVQPSMICSVAYKGAEMIFCTDSANNVVGICARTRVTLQYLDVPGKVVLLQSNPANGMVFVACSNGIVQTYHPEATSPNLTAYGRYRWMNGPQVNCCDIFQVKEWTTFQISSSFNYKLLVGHGKQIAVFLVAPVDFVLETAESLWTTQVDANLVSACISGDGESIAYVLEGEGTKNDNPYGVRTLLKELEGELEASSRSIGVIYRPGPFLVHTAPVTSLSFRGFGHIKSGASEENEGNDLLMTISKSDNDVRIYSQNSWKQLIHWTTPPQTKAEWVRGLSAFNLGDLEPRKTVKKGACASQAASRRPSYTSGTDESSGTAAFQAGLTGQSLQQTGHANAVPTTSAGAWIAEITFRSSFPALRLSRLSYLKRGNDEAQPAHFESVSALLPAGSIVAEGVLDHDMGLSVQGIWPAWHPWSSDGREGQLDGSLRGSAMNFLGVGTAGGIGDISQGGTHSPPSELRVMASHPKSGHIVLMEFPLWGDQDFGAMELGSPLRYLMAVSQIQTLDTANPVSCLDYEFNKLCAQIEASSKAVSVTWRVQGNHSTLPENLGEHDSDEVQVYSDWSVLPVPLALPSLRLPSSLNKDNKDCIVAVQWWPDDHRGGPPQLLCICSSGTLVLYEMPPPWSALEPVMPSYDPIGSSTNASLDGSGMNSSIDDDASDVSVEKKEYEVMIIPHPEFGIGLRLESQMDGMPAIAGSFKQHPLNGGRLPAERTGMIMLGDELLTVNGISLEGITFDEIIATVRQVGAEARAGTSLSMRFRPVMANRGRNNSVGFSAADNSEVSRGARRTKEQILGLTSKSYAKHAAGDAEAPESSVTLPNESLSGVQQEFARIVALVRAAIPEFISSNDAKSSILLMAWTCGLGSPKSGDLRGAALLLFAQGKCLHAKRLEVSADCDPSKARCVDLGNFDLQVKIRSIQAIKTLTDHWGVNVCDENYCSHLVFVSVQDNSTLLKASFQEFSMVAQTSEASIFRAFSSQLLGTMPESIDARRTVSIWSGKPDPKSMESVADTDRVAKSKNTHTYCKATLSLDEIIDCDDVIVDFRFVTTGLLDAFPLIVIFTSKVAVVFTRAGSKNCWTPQLTLNYPNVRTSTKEISRLALCDTSRLSPADSLPHLTPAVVNLIDSSDEINYIKSDWHPESVLSFVCMDNQGPLISLRKNVKGVFEWLSDWTHPDRDSYPTFNHRARLGVTPLSVMNGRNLLAPYSEEDSDDIAVTCSTEKAANMMALLTTKKPETEKKPECFPLEELQKVLCPGSATPKGREGSDGDKDQPEFQLPPPLRTLNRDELRLLWSLGELVSSPPKFKSLDAPAQHSLFCASLMKQLKTAKWDGEQEESNQSLKNETMTTVQSTHNSHFSRRQTFSLGDTEKKKLPGMAVAGAFAALVSNTQMALVDRFRPLDTKLDWESARSLRLPFWIRCDDRLRKLSEEIGMRVFRDTKDVMESAFFFIIAGNLKTLKNLAATDSSVSGRKFVKFLSDYDFSSPRGRKAAEKNAYSLLRKNRYIVSAAFFLMAKPPMMKSAVETILSKTGDLDLAFMATRLVEAAAEREARAPFPGGLALGALGGGGGYAGGMGVVETASVDEARYEDWVPKLGKASKALLRNRGLELAEGDPCLRSLQLVWLSKKEEAAAILSSTQGADAAEHCFPESFDTPSKTSAEQPIFQKVSYFHAPVEKKYESANDRVLLKANEVIDFVSRPFLLKAINASMRSRWAGTVLTCHALTRRGIELPAARCILQNTSLSDYDEESKTREVKKRVSAQTALPGPQSAIFDSYAAAPNQQSSSIFDTFDAAPRKKADEHNPQRGQVSSSIFDGFHAAPQKPKQTGLLSTNGDMESSIFDGFNAAPSRQTQPLQVQKANMSSSIFDSFETATPKARPPAATQIAAMNSSIFDSFDVPANKQPSITISKSNDLVPTETSMTTKVEEEEPELPSLMTPEIWKEWRNDVLITAVARRLLREIGRQIDRFHVDLIDPPMKMFRSPGYPLIPSSAAEILRLPCDGGSILDNVTECLNDVCKTFGLEEVLVVAQALCILDVQAQPKRLVLAVLLHIASDRTDLAEDVIRDAAISQMQRCNIFSLSQDHLVDDCSTIHHHASQHLRRLAIRVSWQLELCLWLHRGGVIPLSDIVLKEAIVAVRVGMVLASWGKNHECLNSLIKNDPDCPLDYTAGRQLWSSMKMIAGLEEGSKKIVTKGSGGWEFLVDCRRDEATSMLRKRPPGSFIIRPHPEDNSVFTLSFKTNLKPIEEVPLTAEPESNVEDGKPPRPPPAKPVKKDDVVQHAIMRLSDAGFRCGSFGPFTTLLKLLEAVSESLPFDLLFDKPPTQGIIKEDDQHQPSPNAVFLRKFALSSQSDHVSWGPGLGSLRGSKVTGSDEMESSVRSVRSLHSVKNEESSADEYAHLRRFGAFSQLLTLTEIRRQLSAVAAADYDDVIVSKKCWEELTDDRSVDSLSEAGVDALGVEERYALASRLVRPFLTWCHAMEAHVIHLIAPALEQVSKDSQEQTCAVAFTESSIELAPREKSGMLDGGDAMIRQIIQPESGVEFRTLRVGEGGDSAMIVLFSKSEALAWVKSSGMEKNNQDALSRLARMEERRVIEPISLADLHLKTFSQNGSLESDEDVMCYRFVDPWEVEALENREGETMAAALGRQHYLAFSVNSVANSCEAAFRKLGGLHLLGLWSNEKGGLRLTKAVASVHAPWERDSGGDLEMSQGTPCEPTPFQNSIRRHLYRNTLFRRLEMPQRFLALVQVELLDLKNLSAGGAASLSVYALLRLKRPGSSAPLTQKARTLDSAATSPMKIGKSSGPNAPASWGSLVRFRFPLPEEVSIDGVSYDGAREALFKGPPCTLQLSVYEKKFMSDTQLGGADVKLDALASGGQMEEWVPLKSEKHGINWFARIRLTLRFELMCLPMEDDLELPPSVGLAKIRQLSKAGGTHEDKMKKSASTPDILSYFESMVY